MKIIRLTLVNFARVLSGLGKTKIEINLLNTKEHINMLIGENGSGKTSIMQCLHPFAYNGSIGDSTMNADLIIDGKDGKKEIDIVNQDKVYHIEHIYTRKKDNSISVKSFISQDNEELNPSGTGVGFKSIVQEKLGVNETFLTLLSVGNSIDGFVEMTSADRKTFSTKIFSELGVYSKYYKNMSTLARSMNSLLSNVTSKLSRYRGVNKEELTAKLNDITKNIATLKDSHNETLTSIGGVRSQLDMHRSNIQDYNDLQYKIKTLLDDMAEAEKKINISGDNNYLQSFRDSTMESLSSNKNELEITNAKIDGLLNSINDLLNESDKLNLTLNKYDSGKTMIELVEYVSSLESQISKLSKSHTERLHVTNMTKDDLIKATVYLDELTRIIGNMVFHTSDEDLIMSVVNKYGDDGKSIRSKISSQYDKMQAQVQSYNIINQFGAIDVKLKSMCDCKTQNDCPYVAFYNEYMKTVYGNITETALTYKQNQEKLSYLDSVYKCIDCIDEGFKYIKSHKDIFDRLPKEIFNKDTFLQEFVESRKIYNDRVLVSAVEELEDKEKLAQLKNSLKSAKEQLDMVSTNENLYKDSRDRLAKCKEKLDKNNAALKEAKDHAAYLKFTITQLESKLSNIDMNIETRTLIDSCRNDITEYSNQLRAMDDTIQKINYLKDTLDKYRAKEQQLYKNIQTLDNTKQSIQITINNLETLEKEEMELRTKYDDVMEIRKAVSPVTGIPVEFIEHYVKSEMIDRINVLLDSVYHGKLRLRGDLVVVNDKEFTIPYQKHNTIVKDISKASDGERAIMTFAFSLVLIQSSMDEYNIMLLDEIDTSLDHYGRTRFISLLETFMETIHAEQLFLISHNNMFDSYPVNVIMTSEMNLSSMTNKSVIKLYS